mmetsp:Transcript_27801/g.59444  ORF Transcript_27801/g.59444 Transcript_27801/m.59444 type:complete len:291 (-) Transcript_27801:247-1119(-)
MNLIPGFHLISSDGIEDEPSGNGCDSQYDDSHSGNDRSLLFFGRLDLDQGLADIVFTSVCLALRHAVDPAAGGDAIVEVGVLSSVDALRREGSPAFVGGNNLEFFRSGLAALDSESLGRGFRVGGPRKLDLVVGKDLEIQTTPGEFLGLAVHQEGTRDTGLLVLALAPGLGLLLHDGFDLGLGFRRDVHPRSVFDTVGVSEIGSALHFADLLLRQLVDFFLEGHVVGGVGGFLHGGGNRSGGCLVLGFFRREKGGVHGKGDDITLLADGGKRLSSRSKGGCSLGKECDCE